MTGNDEETLAELLLRWDELRERGLDVSSVELCKDCPQLLDELERRIAALKATDWLDRPLESEQVEHAKEAYDEDRDRILGSRYRLDELIAEGGFALVWRAYDLELCRSVAVKMPKKSRVGSSETFLEEARRVASLKHPGIVPVYDVGRDSGDVFIVSEFIDGGNLGDRIREGRLPTEKAIGWAVQIAEALEFAHQHGVIHRDIKPANVLIDLHGRALVADFGIAQSAKGHESIAPALGTLRYMAPEQLAGGDANAQSDVYSLGVVLFEMLTGELPGNGHYLKASQREGSWPSLSDKKRLGSRLQRICVRALQPTPESRYSSADAFAADLIQLQSNTKGRAITAVIALLSVASIVGLLVWGMVNSQSSSRKKALPKLDASWIARVAALPADAQVKEVVAKLKELNPDFTGEMVANQFDGKVNLVELQTDQVEHIGPLAAFKHLQFVNLAGSFRWRHNGRLVDLSPLAGLPIEEIDIHGTLVDDLKPLEHAPLTVLVMNNTRITDLAPIRNAKLTRLDIHNTDVHDLTPLVGMPLNNLHMANTQVRDLSPLQGMSIVDLRCQYCQFTDLAPLRGMPLHSLECQGNRISDLSPLMDSSICNLNIYKTSIADWRPLTTMKNLRMISFDFDPSRDSEILRSVAWLEQINERSAAEFWKAVQESSQEEAGSPPK